MSALGMRPSFGSMPGSEPLRFLRRLFQARVFFPLCRIAISLFLLPLDNAIFLVVVVLGRLSSGSVRRRQDVLEDVRFYPKTVLVTGVDTPAGLNVARSWYHEGHRVVGADVGVSRLASGPSKSRSLAAYYCIPKPQYVSRLLDIIQREKVDIWVPCSSGTSVFDDALAKQAIESRTRCKCITLDPEISSEWARPESFVQYLVGKDLPVVESHQVHSRDSIHRILHRSPTKVYHMHQGPSTVSDPRVIVLPKRTLSLTYSEVSEIQISQDTPWLLQQHARMGEFLAALLVVRGQLSAVKICPANRASDWGDSPLHRGLAMAIHNLMERFASRAGPQMTGHFCVRLMVDEELEVNSVRYIVHIAGCTQGATAASHLLQDSPPAALVAGYLAILSSENGGMPKASLSPSSHARPRSLLYRRLSRPRLYQLVRRYEIQKTLPSMMSLAAQRVDYVIDEAIKLAFCWENWRFSLSDPFPWWWHAHIYQPLRELDLIMNSRSTPFMEKS
ncbi:hypothetical protein P175DRAFT_0480680 [Aspergillus ochraceoroseus IBT 24754]|uniref:Uncharacterized protein n=2 Tax=Aspergillus ochraceoroseus TaxID=138278 RepID=A0A2T5LUJ0_9EURO|nr:uncharacterized protein P175DRAFT_0480680 [Aspergillus ochraceoroseus IBT 24754]KKK25985.1 hypothetical protein AOCH_007541 [Aspergillus ochraceoroseus]PTU19949.1 hypothetical protein P175DRAFT_0480680 [Aspergillus ochraceoroseus IBT 24754]